MVFIDFIKQIPPPPFGLYLQWQGKYQGMKKRRDACKEAIEILQKAMGIANDEKTNLHKSKC